MTRTLFTMAQPDSGPRIVITTQPAQDGDVVLCMGAGSIGAVAAQTIKTGVCAIGAFSDDKLNQALGLDGKQEFAVYAASVGRI